MMNFCDVIHGRIAFPPLIDAIIKTSYFKRLLEIKQVGCVYKIYKEGIHTRYDHCIGTYFLAGKLLNCLERNTKGLQIPEFYKDCVKIAGLLHDVGHGPFSHFWERVGKFDHEDSGAECIDNIFRSIPVPQIPLRNGIELIKALIKGDKEMLSVPIDSKFEFLFEIIHNKQCEIDVDKWDYLKRDAFFLKRYLPANVTLNLDFDEVFTDAKVSEDGTHIQYKYEHFDKMYNLFKSREILHIYIYQNTLTKVLENILIEAIRRAEKMGYKFRGRKLSKISSEDQERFLELTDKNVLNFLNEIDDWNIRELMNCFKLTAVEEIHPKSCQEIMNVPEYLTVHLKIERAGEKMPENCINFYGNIKDKPQIKQTYGFYEKTHYFRSTL